MTPEEMTQAQLRQELSWSRAQNAELYEEFCALQERMKQATQAYAALEQVREELTRENERLRRSLLAYRQRDALEHLCWKREKVKNEEMVLITGCDAACSGVCIPERIDGCAVLGVEQEAFCRCDALEWVQLPRGMRAVAERAFADCPALTRVYLPQSIVWISPDAFCGSEKAALYCPLDSPAAAFARQNGFVLQPAAAWEAL